MAPNGLGLPRAPAPHPPPPRARRAAPTTHRPCPQHHRTVIRASLANPAPATAPGRCSTRLAPPRTSTPFGEYYPDRSCFVGVVAAGSITVRERSGRPVADLARVGCRSAPQVSNVYWRGGFGDTWGYPAYFHPSWPRSLSIPGEEYARSSEWGGCPAYESAGRQTPAAAWQAWHSPHSFRPGAPISGRAVRGVGFCGDFYQFGSVGGSARPGCGGRPW